MVFGKMKVIGWVHDFSSSQYLGGAQLTCEEMLRHIPEDIIIRPIGSYKDLKEVDLVVINNSRTVTYWELLRNKRLIFWIHDLIPEPYIDIKNELMIKAEKVFFLSPLLHRKYCEIYDVDIEDSKVDYVPPIVDYKRFNTIVDVEQREKRAAWIGDIQFFKGIDEVLLWAREHNTYVDFYGPGVDFLIERIKISRYGDYLGIVSPNEMQFVYNKYRYFIHLPKVIEGGGRTVIEALLCGCKIIHNSKIGILSYFEEDDINNLTYSDITDLIDSGIKKFWDTVKSISSVI